MLGMFIYMYIFLMAPIIFPLATMVALLVIALILNYRDHLNPASNDESAIPDQTNGMTITPPVVCDSPKKAMDPSAIARLPTFRYEKEEKSGSVQCIICLTAFEDGEAVKQFPRCRHLYHPNCIDRWLSHNYTCPICRDGDKMDAEGNFVIVVS
ncbi:RING/U-box superfamily protein [Rhynchospora pubera]|uniref:RING-type E3 ubiquitin transferase n=1 Tax=Rhynchospora pubera TaxID=906938 RepID=A0AAV8DTR6_9POAL|nr:RING/U-box superfamily protein [Rhynchospora pubera]